MILNKLHIEMVFLENVSTLIKNKLFNQTPASFSDKELALNAQNVSPDVSLQFVIVWE